MARDRSGDSTLRRRRGTRPLRTRILVFTEGKVTEPDYINGLAAFLRATGVRLAGPALRNKSGPDPLELVKDAEKALQADPDLDSVWCVFDVDEHTTLPEAIAKAERAGIQYSISNPCFEL